MTASQSILSFQETLSAAIEDMLAHGFDSAERVDRWTRELRISAEREAGITGMEEKLRNGLAAVYRRMVDQGGALRLNPGVSRFTLDRVKPLLRSELDRRIMASANLIKLNRAQAIEKTLQRFQGWSTSIPKGGSTVEAKRDTRRNLKKAIGSLPFEERRVLIDQGHKLTAAISDVIATDGGAIAARWSSRWRQAGYDYREDHKERDGQIYLIRDSWAHKAGLVKKGAAGYSDEITQPASEVFCRCRWVYVYAIRELPQDMLTQKGKRALVEVGQRLNATEAFARADSADSDARVTKDAAGYVSFGARRPSGQSCRYCTMFLPPDACKAVLGEVAGFGWCRLFELDPFVIRTGEQRAERLDSA